MRLERLHIIGFGRFQQRSWEAGAGLNLVYAPNEAGKTTLQRFIYGMLYGFARHGIRQRRETEDVARYRPWAGAPYRGSLVYRLANGRRFRVERDFHTGAVRLLDEVTGEDVSSQYRTDVRRELLFADAQLGLSGPEFASTVFVSQLSAGQVSGLGDSAKERLANLRDTGSEDVSVQQALQRLREAAEAIGSERAAKRPLGQAVAQVSALVKRRDEADAAWQAAAQARAQAQSLREQVDAATTTLGELERELAAAEAAERQAVLQRVESEQAKLSEAAARLAELEPYAQFPHAQADEARRLAADASRWREQAEQEAAALAEAEARLAAIETELAAFAPLQALGSDGGVELDKAYEAYRLLARTVARREAELAERLAELERQQQRLATAHLPLNTGEPLVALTEWERRLDTIEADRRKWEGHDNAHAAAALAEEVAALTATAASRRRLWLGLVGGIGIVVLVAGLIVSRWAFAGLALAPLLWFVRQSASKAEHDLISAKQKQLREAQRQQADQAAQLAALQEQLASLLSETGAADAAELRQKLAVARDAAPAVTRLQDLVANLRRDVDELLAELASRQQTVRRYLTAAAETARVRAAAVEPDSPVAEAAATITPAAEPDADIAEAAVVAASEQWRAWHAVQRQREETRREATELGRRYDAAVRRQQEADQALQSILQAADVADLPAYLTGCAKRSEYEHWQRKAAEHRNVLNAALAGRTVDELQAALAEALAAASDFSGQPRPLSELQSLVARAADRLQQLRTELARTESQVETMLRSAPNLAQVEADLAEAEKSAARLREQRAALDIAQATLAAVLEEAHRDFAPKLNAVIGQLTAKFTGGRYAQVRVDESLGMTVEVPEDGSLRQVAQLSAGTFDQMYFAMRLAIADLLGPPGEPLPLFLDDTFVQADAARLAACLAHVADLAAAGRQVWLFTCHEREATALREAAAARNVPLTELAL